MAARHSGLRSSGRTVPSAARWLNHPSGDGPLSVQIYGHLVAVCDLTSSRYRRKFHCLYPCAWLWNRLTSEAQAMDVELDRVADVPFVFRCRSCRNATGQVWHVGCEIT